MRPLDKDSSEEDDKPQAKRGRKVFGQTIYVNAFEHGAHHRSPRQPRVETLPDRIVVKLWPKENYRGRMKYQRTRSIPELCRITLKPTGERNHDHEELEEVYISQYTHSFEKKIEKPHIVAWKQDFAQRHVKHRDSKMCIMNSPMGSNAVYQPERPKSAPPGSLTFDFDKMEYRESLSRRSTSPTMLADNWMDFDEVDYQNGFRPLSSETTTAYSTEDNRSLGHSVSSDGFNSADRRLNMGTTRGSYDDEDLSWNTMRPTGQYERQLAQGKGTVETIPQRQSLTSRLQVNTFQSVDNKLHIRNKRQVAEEVVAVEAKASHESLSSSAFDDIFYSQDETSRMRGGKITSEERNDSMKVQQNELVTTQKVGTYRGLSSSALGDILDGESDTSRIVAGETLFAKRNGSNKVLRNQLITEQAGVSYQSQSSSDWYDMVDNLDNVPQLDAEKITPEIKNDLKKAPTNELVTAQEVVTYESMNTNGLDDVFGSLDDKPQFTGEEIRPETKKNGSQKEPTNELVTTQKVVTYERLNSSGLDDVFGSLDDQLQVRHEEKIHSREVATDEMVTVREVVNNENMDSSGLDDIFNSLDERTQGGVEKITLGNKNDTKKMHTNERVTAKKMATYESLDSSGWDDIFANLDGRPQKITPLEENNSKKIPRNEKVTVQREPTYESLDSSSWDAIFDGLDDNPTKVGTNEVVTAQKVTTYQSLDPSIIDEIFDGDESELQNDQVKPLIDENVAQTKAQTGNTNWILLENAFNTLNEDTAAQNGQNVTENERHLPKRVRSLTNENAVSQKTTTTSEKPFGSLDDDDESDDENLTQQARSLISSLRSSVKTPETFRKSVLHTVHNPKPMKATSVIIPQQQLSHGHLVHEQLPREILPKPYSSKERLSREHLPQEYSPQEYLPQEYLPQEHTSGEHPPRKHLPQEYSPQDYTVQEHIPKKDVPQQYSFPRQSSPEYLPEPQPTPDKTKETRQGPATLPKPKRKSTSEKGLDDRLHDLIGGMGPSDNTSAFTVTSAAQQAKPRNYVQSTYIFNNGNGSKANKVGYKATPLTLVHGKVRYPGQKPATKYNVPSHGEVPQKTTVDGLQSTPVNHHDNTIKTAPTMINYRPAPAMKQLPHLKTVPYYLPEKPAKTSEKSSSSSSTSLLKIDQSDDRIRINNDVTTNKPDEFDQLTKKQQPEAEIIVLKAPEVPKETEVPKASDVIVPKTPEVIVSTAPELIAPKVTKVHKIKSSPPSNHYSRVSAISRPRTSSLGSDASYKRRLTSAWIEQQRQNILDSKEQRLRRTKSAEFRSEDFDWYDDTPQFKLKHSKSEASFDQLNAMYDPYDERPGRHRPRVVHTQEPTVITRARSVEHKIHHLAQRTSPPNVKPSVKSVEDIGHKEPLQTSPLMKQDHHVSYVPFPSDDKPSDTDVNITSPKVVTAKIERTSEYMDQSEPSSNPLMRHVENTAIPDQSERRKSGDLVKVISLPTQNTYENMELFSRESNYVHMKLQEKQVREVTRTSSNENEGLVGKDVEDNGAVGITGTQKTPRISGTLGISGILRTPETSGVPGTLGTSGTSGTSEKPETSGIPGTSGSTSTNTSPTKGRFYAKYVEKAVNIGVMKSTEDLMFDKDEVSTLENVPSKTITGKRNESEVNTIIPNQPEQTPKDIDIVRNVITIKSSVTHEATSITHPTSPLQTNGENKEETTHDKVVSAEHIEAENSKPVEKRTAVYSSKPRRASVRHISTSHEDLYHDSNKPSETVTTSPTTPETQHRKKRTGKVGVILNSIGLSKLRKAKSEPNLQNEPLFPELEENKKNLAKNNEERHEKQDSVPSFKDGRPAEEPTNDSRGVSEGTTTEHEDKKHSMLSSKVSAFYPKFKKFKHKLTKHRSMEKSDPHDGDITKDRTVSNVSITTEQEQKEGINEKLSRSYDTNNVEMASPEILNPEVKESQRESSSSTRVTVVERDPQSYKVEKVTPMILPERQDKSVVKTVTMPQDTNNNSFQTGTTRVTADVGDLQDNSDKKTAVYPITTDHTSRQTLSIHDYTKEEVINNKVMAWNNEFHDKDEKQHKLDEKYRENENGKTSLVIASSYQTNINGNTSFGKAKVVPLNNEVEDKREDENSLFVIPRQTELRKDIKEETRNGLLTTSNRKVANYTPRETVSSFTITSNQLQPQETLPLANENTFVNKELNQSEHVHQQTLQNGLLKGKVSTVSVEKEDDIKSEGTETKLQYEGLSTTKVTDLSSVCMAEETVISNGHDTVEQRKEDDERSKKSSSDSEKHEFGTKIKGFISKVKLPFHHRSSKKNISGAEGKGKETETTRNTEIEENANQSDVVRKTEAENTESMYSGQQHTARTGGNNIEQTDTRRELKTVTKLVANETNEYTTRKTEVREAYNDQSDKTITSKDSRLVDSTNISGTVTNVVVNKTNESASDGSVPRNTYNTQPDTTMEDHRPIHSRQGSKTGLVTKFIISDTEYSSSKTGQRGIDGNVSENDQRYPPLTQKDTTTITRYARQPAMAQVAIATTKPITNVVGIGGEGLVTKAQVNETHAAVESWEGNDDVFLRDETDAAGLNERRLSKIEALKPNRNDVSTRTKLGSKTQSYHNEQNTTKQPGDVQLGRTKGDIINDGRFEAVLVDAAPKPQIHTAQKTINLQERSMTVQNEFSEHAQTMGSRTERRGVSAFSVTNDEASRKQALKYIEKVTVRKDKGASQVRRGIRKDQLSRITRTEHGHQETGDEKTEGRRIGTRDVTGELREDQKIGTSRIWRETREDQKTGASQFAMPTEPGQSNHVITRRSGDWGKDNRGGLSPSDNETSDFKDSVTESIKGTSDDELLQLIEDEIDSDGRDETSTKQDSPGGDIQESDSRSTTPRNRRRNGDDNTWRRTSSIDKDQIANGTTRANAGANKKTGLETVKSETTGTIREAGLTSETKSGLSQVSIQKTTMSKVNVRKSDLVSSKHERTRSFEQLNSTMSLAGTGGHEAAGWNRKQTGFMDVDQNHSISFVPSNTLPKRSVENGFVQGEIPVKQKSMTSRHSYSSKATGTKEIAIRKSSSKTKLNEDKKRNSKSSEDLASIIRRLVSEDEPDTDESPPKQEPLTSARYSFNDDTKVGSRGKLSRQKKMYASLPAEQRNYRNYEGDIRNNGGNVRSSKVSPKDYPSVDVFGAKQSTEDQRLRWKTTTM